MQNVRRAGYFLILILAAALTTAFAWQPASPAKFTGLSALNVPTRVANFTGQDVAVDAQTRGALSSAEAMERDYRDSDGRLIQLTLIGGTDRSALHDPRSCLVGSGWRIDNDHVENLPVAGKEVPARTCTASLDQPGARNTDGCDIVYLYVTHRRVIASATSIRLALLESALLEQNDAPVYFVRFVLPLGHGRQFNAAEHAQLLSFAAEFWSRISPSILKGENA